MTHVPEYEWVSVQEASRRLSRSVSTIRRMIEAGELVGEREPLGGSRDRYRVRLPVEASQDASGAAEDAPPPPSTADAPETPQNAPATTADLLRAAIDPYVQMNQRIAELYQNAVAETADLRERAGRWEERAIAADRRADRAEAQAAALRIDLERAHAELADERRERHPWWRWW